MEPARASLVRRVLDLSAGFKVGADVILLRPEGTDPSTSEIFDAKARGPRTLEEAAQVNEAAAKYLADLQKQQPEFAARAKAQEKSEVDMAFATDMLRGISNIQEMRKEADLPDITLDQGGTLAERFEQYVAIHSQDLIARRGGKKIPATADYLEIAKPSEAVVEAVDAERKERNIFDPARTLG
ncbi:MAG: hypothetical protein AB8B83_05645 [Bdellovibrionales bacterium]